MPWSGQIHHDTLWNPLECFICILRERKALFACLCLSSNVMVRFRIDLGFSSSRFMQRINSGRMGNLAQVHIFFPLSCHKSGNGQQKVREKSGNFTQSRGKFMFFREVRENRIFVTNSSTLIGYYSHKM